MTDSAFGVSRPRTHMRVPGLVYAASVRGDGSMALLVVPGAASTQDASLDVIVNWHQTLDR